MNRITQCMHGRGTVSEVMKHRHGQPGEVPSRYLAFSGMPRPVIFWNLTDRCNLSCVHCYSRSGPGHDITGELTTGEALDLIDDLARSGIPLILFSGGEPLLRHDLWELARHARDRGIRTALSTNGTLIDTEIAGKIRENGIGYVGISLDGATAATHDRFRGTPGAFDRSIAAFSHCLDSGVRCGVRVTLTRENAGELGALIDLARRIGASRFCLYWLVPSGRGREGYARLQLGSQEVQDALDLLYRTAKETAPGAMEFLTVDAPQDCIHLLGSMKQDSSQDLQDAEQLLESLNGGCSAGIRVANIDPMGNIYPCQFARAPEFLIGNIRARPFSSMWSDDTNQVLSRFRNKKASIGGRCSTCPYFELCGGGCRVRAYAVSGNFFGEDPFCFVNPENP